MVNFATKTCFKPVESIQGCAGSGEGEMPNMSYSVQPLAFDNWMASHCNA